MTGGRGRTVKMGRTGGGYFSFSLSLRERVGVRGMKKGGGAAGMTEGFS